MDLLHIHFTKRMLRIINIAEKEVQSIKSKALLPSHLLLACLSEKTGVLGEISLKCNIDLDSLRTIETIEQQPIHNEFFNVPVTKEVEIVIETAMNYMKRYNQIFLNEGHLLKALINTKVVDHYLTDENKEIILSLGTTSRNMITHLGTYSCPNLGSPFVRKVNKDDYHKLIQFVENHFSVEWAQTVKSGLSLDPPSIYIALDEDEEIVGFAAFDVYQNKKCYFGPMGVMTSKRIKGIGYSLLHYCLKDMKEIGYEYAIIGGAGPIEFYENVCNAVVIPVN